MRVLTGVGPVVSQLLSQEQNFRCYGCSGTGHDVQELHSHPAAAPLKKQMCGDRNSCDAPSWQILYHCRRRQCLKILPFALSPRRQHLIVPTASRPTCSTGSNYRTNAKVQAKSTAAVIILHPSHTHFHACLCRAPSCCTCSRVAVVPPRWRAARRHCQRCSSLLVPEPELPAIFEVEGRLIQHP